MTQILKQSTEIKVRIGPAVAVGDGFTPVVTLDLSTADEAELLKANGAATSSIAAATFAAITGADGWYDLTLTTTHTDTVGTLDVVVNDDSLILPIFARFQVIEEAVFDAYYAASAGMAVTLAAGAVTAAAIATNAIDADAMADGAITAATFAAGAIDATAIANGAIDAATFAAGAIDATAIANGAIDAATFAAGAIDAAAISADAGAELADAFLNRDMSTGTDSGSTTVRTMRQALRFLRNKWAISAGTLTVYKEDDSTSSWTASVSTDAAAEPVIGNDPGGP